MKDEFLKSNSDDSLVDELAAHLRDQYVPTVPRQLLEHAPDSGIITTRQNPLTSVVTWVIGIAVVVIAMFGIAHMFLPERDKPRLSHNDPPTMIYDNLAIEPTRIHVQNLNALHPFEGLEREIADMKSEIEQLKTDAGSLDAIRKLNAMMTRN